MKESWYRRRKTQRKLIIIALVLFLLALLFTFTPTYFARYYIADALDDFGIKHEGIKTVRVNLWKREVWVGPVKFRSGEADPGQLGQLGFKLHLFPAFQKHAMVERVIIRGVDINIVRKTDNTITINGISPDQFQAAPSDSPQSPDQKSSPWGYGLVDLDMQDCRLVLSNETGGKLHVDIDSLQLANFASWRPDDPGTIVLKARVNGIELDVTGEARPFADDITLTLDEITREFSLDKIIAFTGPAGLDRVAGVTETKGHHELIISRTGRLEGHSVGKMTITGASYTSADKHTLVAKQAEVNHDTRYHLNEQKDLQVNGQLKLAISNAEGNMAGKTSFSAESAQIELANLKATRRSDSTLMVAARPQIMIEKGKYSGQVHLSMDALLDVLRYLQSISLQQQSEQEKTGLEKWQDDEVTLPRSDVAITKLNSTLPRFEFKTQAGALSLDIVTETNASGIKVAAKERKTDISSLVSQIDTLQLRSGHGKLELKLKGNTAVSQYTMLGPIGKGTINTIELGQNLGLKINQGEVDLQGSANTLIKGSDIQLHKTSTLPKADLDVKSINADLNKIAFSTKNKKMKWSVDIGALIKQAAIKYSEGENTRTKFDRIELRKARLDQNFNVGVEALVISGLDALVTRQFIDGVVEPEAQDKQPASKENGADDAVTAKQELNSQVVIGQLILENGARLRFRDKRVEPPVIVDLDIEKAEVRNIDTSKPKEQAHASIIAKINEFTHFVLNGQATAVGPQMDMTLSSKLENLDLPAFSSYAAEFGGVYLDQGQLSTDVNLSARNGELDGKIILNIQKLEFNTLSEADAQRLSDKAGMPISTAASLLRDRHGNIDLTLPVFGTVSDPEVDISSAIGKAAQKTLITIYPPTLVLSILASGLEGGEMSVAPILFKPGSGELDDKAKQDLDKLVSLVKDRPRLLLSFCGRTTPEDFRELIDISIKLSPDAQAKEIERRSRLIQKHGPQMRELATERSRVIERYLIQEKGLTSNQVSSCRPVFDPDDKEPPRAIVKL
jgi:hypothetical protein